MSYQSANRAVRDAMADVPAPPRQCDVAGCDGKAAVLFVLSEHAGNRRVGIFSDSCNESFGPNGKCSRTVKPGYDFVRWIARCDDCYQRDLVRSHLSRDDYLLDAATVRARTTKPPRASVLAGFSPLAALLTRMLDGIKGRASP